jgi:hypothetical protein
VIQVHYHKSGKPEKDQTRVGLHFAKGRVERAAYDLMVLPVHERFRGLRIQPGDANREVRTSLTLPRDVTALSATPHMHLIGKDMKVVATLPSGEVKPLIYVKDWDFNWQLTYRFQSPIALPKGTRLDMTAHFDNSAENPSNPSRPPKLVKWGEQTTDEMCIAFLEVVPKEAARSPADLRPPTPGSLLRQLLWSSAVNHSAEGKNQASPAK